MDTMTIKAFRSKTEAQEYVKFQGWKSSFAQVRMFHYPESPFANVRGNVVAVRISADGRYKWIFDGVRKSVFQFAFMHNQPSYLDD